MPETTAQLLGNRYRLQEPIAKGGMAIVWRAVDQRLGRQVAVKVLHTRFADDPNFLERFRREAVAAASFNHPNIVTVFDFGDDQEIHFLVMELVEGPSLARLLGPTGRLTPPETVTMLRSVLSALSYAHERGVVHRDIKPANILVAPDSLKVGDFGIARAFASSELTATGAVIGTASYLAPEQAEGKRVDHRADLYSLACVGYRCLGGRLPWIADSDVGVALARTLRPPEPLLPLCPGTPRRLIQVIEAALARQPANRYQSAAAMFQALDGLPAVRLSLEKRSRSGWGPTTGSSLFSDSPVSPFDAVSASPSLSFVNRPSKAASRTSRSSMRMTPRLDSPSRVERALSRQRAGEHARRMARLRRLVVAIAVALTLMAAFALLMPSGSKRPAMATTTAARESAPIRVVSVRDFDPFGDHAEHPGDAGRVVDGDPAGGWTTETYRSADLAHKPGVGLILDLGRSVKPRDVRVTLSAGTTFELRTADNPAPGLQGWSLVPQSRRTAAAAGPDTAAPVTVTVPTEGTAARYWLVWITGLPRATSGFQTEVRKAVVDGA